MCRYETEDEWLRPRRNGSDMTHRHFPVSSRHSASSRRIESAPGYSSIRARSVASFRVYAISKKGVTFIPPPPPANSRAHRGHRESRIYPPNATNGVASTLCKHQFPCSPATLKTADRYLTSRELPCE